VGYAKWPNVEGTKKGSPGIAGGEDNPGKAGYSGGSSLLYRVFDKKRRKKKFREQAPKGYCLLRRVGPGPV